LTCAYYIFSNGIDILSWTVFGYILNGKYQFLATLVGLFITIFLVFKISKVTLRRIFSLDCNRRLVVSIIALGFTFRIMLDPILNIHLLYNDSLSNETEPGVWSYAKQATYLFQYVLLYPIAEETFFRFHFFKRLGSQNTPGILFVFLSAFCFASIHINPWKEFYFVQVLIPFLFGLLSAGLFVRFKSLQLAVLLHGSYNLAHYFFMLNWVENGVVLYSRQYSMYYLAVIFFCLFLFVGLLLLIRSDKVCKT
jgi:membrane protease YdiL (CAAX protease family)